MKLKSRTINPDFFGHVNLLKNLSVEERMIFLGMIMLAEDSGCLEGDVFTIKKSLFALDDDVTLKKIEKTMDKLIDIDELVKYKADGKEYFYVHFFAAYQETTPQVRPNLPLPHWVRWKPYPSNRYLGRYIVNEFLIGEEEPEDEERFWEGLEEMQEPTSSPPPPEPKPEPQPRPATKDGYSPEYEDFWQAYPRKTEKKRAFSVWNTRLREGHKAEDLINAAYNYATLCKMRGTEMQYIKHPSTFLGPSCPFEEFVDGIPESARMEAIKSGKKKAKSNVEKGMELVQMFEGEE